MFIAVLCLLGLITIVLLTVVLVLRRHKPMPFSVGANAGGVRLWAMYDKPLVLQNDASKRVATLYVMQDGDLRNGTTVDPSKVFFQYKLEASPHTKTTVSGTSALTSRLAGRRFIVDDGHRRSVDLIGIVGPP